MKLLLTGCCGFICSHFAKMGNVKHELILIDKSGYTLRLYGMNKNVLKKDLTSEYDLRGITKGVDVVVNFAAETFVDYSISNPRRFVDNNIMGTFNLLEEARKNKVKKFIHISTDEVYGTCTQGFFPEGAPLNPGNPYSATKAACDMLALSYYNTFGIPIIILRCENNYGTYQGKEKAIPTWVWHILKDKPLPLYGDGLHRRMWLRVEDFCSAINTVIEHGKIGDIYNVGAKQEYQNLEIVQRIMMILGKNVPLNFIPDTKARPGHDRRYAVDTDKIERLGWKAKYKVETDLKEVVNWYKENQWWFR